MHWGRHHRAILVKGIDTLCLSTIAYVNRGIDQGVAVAVVEADIEHSWPTVAADDDGRVAVQGLVEDDGIRRDDLLPIDLLCVDIDRAHWPCMKDKWSICICRREHLWSVLWRTSFSSS